MNAIVMAHLESLPFLEVAGHVWRKECDYTHVITNYGCPKKFAWADDVYEWHTDPKHKGIEHCRRLLLATEIASKMDGFTAVSEADGLVAHSFNYGSGALYGSAEQSNLTYREIIVEPYRPSTLFCPWVTDREGWVAIASILRGWLASEWLPDEGYADRVIAAAAYDCGLELRGIGFNRWPKLLPDDMDHVQNLVSMGKCPLIHAVKDIDHLAWFE